MSHLYPTTWMQLRNRDYDYGASVHVLVRVDVSPSWMWTYIMQLYLTDKHTAYLPTVAKLAGVDDLEVMKYTK